MLFIYLVVNQLQNDSQLNSFKTTVNKGSNWLLAKTISYLANKKKKQSNDKKKKINKIGSA